MSQPREILRYRRENIKPADFLRPPTEVFKEQVIELCYGIEKQINRAAVQLLHPGKRWFRNRMYPGFRLGSELEVLMFSPDSEPSKDAALFKAENPNYQPNHLREVRRTGRKVRFPRLLGGLQDVLSVRVETLGKIGREIRTKPGTVHDYVTAIERTQAWFRKRGEKRGFNPVVMSQHFHFSLRGRFGRTNLLKNDELDENVRNAMTDTYHRAFPLVRLPEDIMDSRWDYGIEGSGIRRKGGFDRHFDDWVDILNGPIRVEGRVNNHSYATDPYLNLLINLIGFYRGLVVNKTSVPLDHDHPVARSSTSSIYKFKSAGTDAAYHAFLDHLLVDKVLPQFLPADLIANLHNAVSQYQDISFGDKTAAEVRQQANSTKVRRS